MQHLGQCEKIRLHVDIWRFYKCVISLTHVLSYIYISSCTTMTDPFHCFNIRDLDIYLFIMQENIKVFILFRKTTMCRLRNIAMRDYKESVTTGRTDRQTDRRTDRQAADKVIPMCRYASQATQKRYGRCLHENHTCYKIYIFCIQIERVTDRYLYQFIYHTKLKLGLYNLNNLQIH